MSNKIINTKFSSNMGIGLPISRTTSSKGGHRYLSFSGDSTRYNTNNNYPNYLSYLVYNSPTHGSAIYRKSFMIKGEGFDSSSWKREFSKLMNSINSDFESVNNILEKISWDYAIFNGFALKVVWGNDGYIKELYHIPFTDVRCGIPNEKGKIDYYVISNNWDGQLTSSLEINYKLPTFNPEYFRNGVPTKVKKINGIEVNVPEPTEIQMEQAEQIIYFSKYRTKYSSSNIYYPIPDYIGCLDSVLTEIDTIISNKAKMRNGLGGKTLVILPETGQSQEEKMEIQNNFEGNFTGVENDGAVIIEYANAQNFDKISITQLDPIDPDTYKNVSTSAKEDIITNHLIPAILLEVNMGGGFNNRAEEMKQAFYTYQRSVIKDKQNEICSVFNSLAFWMGYDKETFNIIPFTLETDTLNTNSTTSLS